MKRRMCVTLVLVMALAALAPAAAFALNMQEIGEMAVVDGNATVYVGLSNYIYRTDSQAELCETPARSIVYADDRTILFAVDDPLGQDTLTGAATLELFDLGGSGAAPTTLAEVACEPVYVESDAVVYYVAQTQDSTLVSYSPLTGVTASLVKADDSIVDLRDSIDGLIVSTDAADKLYIAATGQLVDPSVSSQGVTIETYNGFETLFDASGNLYLRVKGAAAGSETAIDTGVLCVTASATTVYYLKADGDNVAFCAYSIKDGKAVSLKEIAAKMLPEICVGGGFVFLLDQNHKVYDYDIETGIVGNFATLNQGVASPYMVATNEQLLVYDAGAASGFPEFSAAYPYAQPSDGSTLTHVSSEQTAPEAEPEEAPAPAPEPVEPPAPVQWTRGSRGEEVTNIQQVLYDQGYPSGKPDGIFGAHTQSALKYLQYDMGLPQTGVVTEEFYHKLMTADLPTYEKYVEMERGDNGVRVYDLQVRLQKLNYLSAKPNGNYGPKTEAAVKLFQKKDGLNESGKATVNTLKKLFSKSAPAYDPPAPKPKPDNPHKNPQYVDEDDLINMVRWLNNEYDGQMSFDKKKGIAWVQKCLYKLGYLTKSDYTKVYDKTTWLAMKHFQNDNDILPHPTGKPDKKSLQALYEAISTAGVVSRLGPS